MMGSTVNQRVLRDESRLVWRAVRDAHVLGISQVGLQVALGDGYKPSRLRYLLDELRQTGFVRCVHSGGLRLWVLGKYMMPGESETAGAGPVAPAQPMPASANQAPHRVVFARCSSIWQYAAQIGA